MKLLNFFISIFNKSYYSKHYTKYLFLTLLGVFFLSFILNISDITLNGNDLIKHYQLEKIRDKEFQKISTIIVGDSSAGNAIDAQYFSSLSHQQTMNLALTGSWGIAGSLGIIKESLKSNYNLKNIIIIQTPDIWARVFSRESILELYSFINIYQYLSLNTIFSHFFNPKEIWWHVKYKILRQAINSKIDYKNDYILQKQKKYSNKLKKLNLTETLNQLKITDSKKIELKMLRDFCKENSLNCILLKGPIHSKIKDNSTSYITILDKLLSNSNELTYIKKTFSYSSECMGDSQDHVDTKCKKNVTNDYFQIISPYLRM